jgi:hypothetical protein
MRVSAYVLAADPAFLAASVRSYYPLVDRIVVSYDSSGRSWSGVPIPVEACFGELTAVDPEGKLEFVPGDFSLPTKAPMECETLQRQAALVAASEGSDWVLQLDGDEVLPDPAIFAEVLARADAGGHNALDYPSRWLYAHTGGGQYLEASSRWWRPIAGYPGPLAVRVGVRLRVARQINGGAPFRVDFRRRNSDPWRSRDTPVHAVIDIDQAALHFSWVRSESEMRLKAQFSGHRDDFCWSAAIQSWVWRQKHPRLAAMGTPFRSRELRSRLRLSSIPIAPQPYVTSHPSLESKAGGMSTPGVAEQP